MKDHESTNPEDDLDEVASGATEDADDPVDADDLEDEDDDDTSDDEDASAEEDPSEEKEPGEEEPEEEIEEVLFADQPVPTRADLRAALDWAFEGEDAPEEYLQKCTEHAHMLLEANTRMNLTKIVEPREVAAKHYLDSWRATRLMPLLGKTVLDLGSGAGFPGIPLALAEPNTRVIVIDSTQKKVDFLQTVIDALELKNCEAVWDRAEEYLARNRCDVVILRAISSVRENVRLLRKVRHSFIDLVMLKGPSWSREVRAGEREAERLGFRLDTVWEHELPDEMGGRAVLVYRAPGGAGL